MKKVGPNVEACLKLADLSDRAKIIWVYLAVCRGRGLGSQKICEQLDLELEEVKNELAILKRRGLITTTAGKFVAHPFLLGTETADDGEDPPIPMMGVVNEMAALYGTRRQERGIPPLHQSAEVRRKLSELATFLNERGILFQDYLTFAEQNTAFLQEKEGIKYPPLNVICGDWLKEKYVQPRRPPVQADVAVQAELTVATDATELREKLVEAGLRTAASLSKAELRHIHNWAINMVADPEGFPEPDPKFAPEIKWCLAQLEGRHADRS